MRSILVEELTDCLRIEADGLADFTSTHAPKLRDGDPIHLGAVPTGTDAAGDDELLRQALDGRFDIASDERPASVQVTSASRSTRRGARG